ncbi:tail needle knob protein [Serratia sp. UGAL515B_01]|uniref:tail needle knob protein n=1 Tax=Serratia sp. UGAL515B_01 TaxID=2986763 RepID=UPI002953DD17|nr:tail needle knob protein [Serratia sp. UGAL515B_01]WON77571.1 tail needle knob protein [Serratia sp. UGAL515B_01]
MALLPSNVGVPGPEGPEGPQGPEGQQGPSGITSVRRKSELLFTGISLLVPQTTTNLINLIKTLTPTSGTFAPFFDTTNNKLVVFNNNSTVTFKINILGSWQGGSSSRSMEVDFVGTTGNRLVESRDVAVTTDTVSLPTFFSVDAGGNLATNGAAITIKSNGGNFTATTILLIAEQMVPTT